MIRGVRFDHQRKWGNMLTNKRKKLLIFGIVYAALATCYHGLGIPGSITRITNYQGTIDPGLASFISTVTSIVLVLMLASVIVLGVLQIITGSQLRKEGMRGVSSTLCGLGDFLLAATLLLGLISTFVYRNIPMITEVTGYTTSDIFSIMTLVSTFPSYWLGIAVGVLYIVSGVTQKRMGKSNRFLLIAGIAHIVSIPILVIASFLIQFTSIEVYYFMTMAASFIVLTGRILRGLSPLAYPKAGQSIVGNSQVYMPPSVGQQEPFYPPNNMN